MTGGNTYHYTTTTLLFANQTFIFIFYNVSFSKVLFCTWLLLLMIMWLSIFVDELKNYFCVNGDIIENQFMYDHHTGKSRGFGFVTYLTEDSVDKLFSDEKSS